MLIKLIKGEMNRLVKYKIALVGIIVSLMWVGMLAAADKESATLLAPMLIFTDAGMMSVLLLCAGMYFEKQEGTLKTTIITPVKLSDVIFSKIIASTLLGLVSATLVSLAVILMYGISIDFLILIVGVILVVVFNSAIAIILSIYSKNFSMMLVNYMFFVLILILPTLLISVGAFGQLGEVASWLILLSPMQSCQFMISSAYVSYDLLKLVASMIYAVAVFFILYKFVILRRFKKYVMEE